MKRKEAEANPVPLSTEQSGSKKPRVVWSVEMHQQVGGGWEGRQGEANEPGERACVCGAGRYVGALGSSGGRAAL